MDYITLGRTGLNVSKAGLGSGGFSRLGLSRDLGENNAVNIVREAFESGINIFDTSAIYGTEKVLGKAFENIDRDKYVISTKFPPKNSENILNSEGVLTKTLEQSLINLKTDYIDILHLHGVLPEDYIAVRDRFMPELIKAKEAGKIGWFGITEMFGHDTSHIMLQTALKDNLWDVVMVGYNMLNFSAQKTILPITQMNNVGTLLMFAVRNALSNKDRLKEILEELKKRGVIDTSGLSVEDPLDFLTSCGSAKSTVDAAYRFCSHSQGIDVVLTGTGSVEHLKTNVQSILSGPLPQDVLNKIYELFGQVDSVSGQ